MSMNFQSQSSKDLRFLVDKLNHLLNRNLTLVAFDELSEQPKKLVGLLNEVIMKLGDPKYVIPDSISELEKKKGLLQVFFYNILGVVKNQKPGEFLEGIFFGQKEIIFPLVYSLLQDFKKKKIRVYLSRYIYVVGIPEEIKQDDEIMTLLKEYENQVSSFKKIHQESLSVGRSSPQTIKQNITKLSKQKEQLERKLLEQQKKVSHYSNWKELFILADKLRDELSQKEKLMKSKKKQVSELNNKSEKLELAKEELHVLNKQVGENQTLSEVLGNLEKRISETKEEFNGKKRNLNLIKKQVFGIKEISSKPLNLVIDELEKDLRSLSTELETVNSEISSYENKPKEEDTELLSAKRTQTIYTNKKIEKEKQLKQLLKSYKEYEGLQNKVDVELKEFEGLEIPTKDEFHKYKKLLMEKIKKSKAIKADLSALIGENVILRQTYKLLATKHPEGITFLNQLKEKHLIHIHEKLLSDAKEIQQDGKTKEFTLEELRDLNEKIDKLIEEKRVDYAPNIEKLRNLTEKHQNLSELYNQKKAIYQNTKQAFQDERKRVQLELNELRDEALNFESLYHSLNIQLRLIEIENQRLDDETKHLKGEKKLNEHVNSYTQLYKEILKELQLKAEMLIKKQNEIEQKFKPSMQQIDQFRNLKQLLTCKIKLLRENPTKNLNTKGHDLIKKSTTVDGVNEFVLT